MIGRKVGSWVLEKELGRGGMGSVFLARHASLPTFAAVKVLSPGLESEDSFRQRFQREADLQAQLRHPNVARVLDYLEDGGQWFLVVEYLDRGSLADLLSQPGARVPRPQALAWIRQALAGLGYAHQKGVVHRDIKPANLLINESGEMVVADFGIARADGAPALTTTGIAIGTPQYMSPEQILTPDRVDRRSDIYSLGVVLYELITGHKPFDSGSQFSVLQAHVSEPPPPPRSIDPSIPAALEAVMMRALAKRPEDRYPDCDAMARDLAASLEPPRAGVAPAGVSVRPDAPMDATIRATSLFVPPPAQNQIQVSPAERGAHKRKSFQKRLALGAALAIVAATLFAFEMARLSNPKPEPTPPPGPQVIPSVTPPAPPINPVKHHHHERPPVVDHTHKIVDPPITTDVVEKPPQPPPDPPSVPSLPERPRVAVIAMGDPILAGSLEQEMERRLGRSLDVADEHGDPEVDELLQREGTHVSQRALGTRLVKSGFQVLVLLRVEPAEQRTVSAFGVSGSLKAARMRLNAYLLPVNRPVGSGWTEPVEYTELSAPAKARNAFIGPTADLIHDINQDWSQLRAGAPAPAR
jgi:hypothetical protein